MDEDKVWLENKLYETKPSVIHANGPTKVNDDIVFQQNISKQSRLCMLISVANYLSLNNVLS